MDKPSRSQKTQNTGRTPQGGEGPSGNNARYHRTAACLPQREVSAVGMGVQLSPRTSGTAAPLWPLADRVPSASKGSTALDVQQTAGRKG